MLLNTTLKKGYALSGIIEPTNRYSIKGIAKKLGAATQCRVRLFEKQSGTLIADILTDQNGNYEFTNLAKVRFFIVAHDPLTQYNAVIQDNVVPK